MLRRSKQSEPKVTPQEALVRGLDGDGYAAYFWCLVAADFGEAQARAHISMLQDAGLVAAEDVALAHYQIACWYAAGEHVARDAQRARSHLAAALGATGTRLDADLLKAITYVREQLGIPVQVDLNRPLGPATPGTPGNVNRAQLDSTLPSEPLLPNARHARLEAPLEPSEAVYAIAASSDGQCLLSGGIAGELLQWDLATRSVVRRCRNAGTAVNTLHVHPAGTLALLGSEDSDAVRILDLVANDFILLEEHSSGAGATAFLPGGARIVTGHQDGQLLLWDLATRKPLAQRDLGHDTIWSLAASHDGRRLAIAAGDFTVRIYKLPELEPESALVHHTHLVHGLAFDATGQRLLSASRDHTMALWDLDAASLVRTLIGHRAGVYAATFVAPHRALSAGLDGQILAWDLETGHSAHVATHGPLHCLAVVGNAVVSGGDDGVHFDELVEAT